MQQASPHTRFFNSLKQVEKRLKLENPSQPSTSSIPPLPPPQLRSPPLPHPLLTLETDYTAAESLSSDVFLDFDQPTKTSSSTLEDSEPAREFLSSSPDFAATHECPSPSDGLQTNIEEESNNFGDIEMLMQLLGLSECNEEDQERLGSGSSHGVWNCDYEDEFYSKIVGVKGPKCAKEVERLDEWIKHFLNGNGEEKREPFILAHLLLGKAVLISEDVDGFGGLCFPTTIDEFLKNDPRTA